MKGRATLQDIPWFVFLVFFGITLLPFMSAHFRRYEAIKYLDAA